MEGIIFDFENSDKERLRQAKNKRDFIKSHFTERAKWRNEILGYLIEPIEGRIDYE